MCWEYRIAVSVSKKNGQYRNYYGSWWSDRNEAEEEKEDVSRWITRFIDEYIDGSITFYPNEDREVIVHFTPSEIESVEVRIDEREAE